MKVLGQGSVGHGGSWMEHGRGHFAAQWECQTETPVSISSPESKSMSPAQGTARVLPTTHSQASVSPSASSL